MEQQENKANWKGALRVAFPATIPVMTGYLCLGIAYGVLMRTAGYGLGWAVMLRREHGICHGDAADQRL